MLVEDHQQELKTLERHQVGVAQDRSLVMPQELMKRKVVVAVHKGDGA